MNYLSFHSILIIVRITVIIVIVRGNNDFTPVIVRTNAENDLELEWRDHLSDKTVRSYSHFCYLASNDPPGAKFLTQANYEQTGSSSSKPPPSSKAVKCSNPNHYYRHRYHTADRTEIKEIGIAVNIPDDQNPVATVKEDVPYSGKKLKNGLWFFKLYLLYKFAMINDNVHIVKYTIHFPVVKQFLNTAAKKSPPFSSLEARYCDTPSDKIFRLKQVLPESPKKNRSFKEWLCAGLFYEDDPLSIQAISMVPFHDIMFRVVPIWTSVYDKSWVYVRQMPLQISKKLKKDVLVYAGKFSLQYAGIFSLVETTDNENVYETVPTYHWKLIAADNPKQAILIVTINDSSRGKADSKFVPVESPCLDLCERFGIHGLNRKSSSTNEVLTYCCGPKTLIQMGYKETSFREINLRDYDAFKNLDIVVNRRWGW